MQLTLNIGLGVSNIITLLVGALIIWLLWQIDHRRRLKAVNHLRRQIRNLIFERRKNSLLENIISGIERGRVPAQKDFQLIDGVVRSAFVVFKASPRVWSIWQEKFRERAFATWRDEGGEEVR